MPDNKLNLKEKIGVITLGGFIVAFAVVLVPVLIVVGIAKWMQS